jgi:hypothetical protein
MRVAPSLKTTAPALRWRSTGARWAMSPGSMRRRIAPRDFYHATRFRLALFTSGPGRSHLGVFRPVAGMPIPTNATGERLGHGRLFGSCRFLWLQPGFEETDPELVAVDPGQFATAKRPTGRRKNQEEFLEADAFDRVGDRQFGAACSNIEHHAALAPGAVDRNHLNVDTMGKFDAIALSSLDIH